MPVIIIFELIKLLFYLIATWCLVSIAISIKEISKKK